MRFALGALLLISLSVAAAEAPDQQLQSVALVHEQSVGCYVRNDPKLPVQRILRTLQHMKTSGEIDDIIRLYTGHPDASL